MNAPRALLVALVSTVWLCTLYAAVDATEATRQRAIVAYDEGRYKEAQEILLSLDAQGLSDGPLLYRLFFCLRATGDPVGAGRALERAVTSLMKENADSPRLESAFYLANAFVNSARTAEARATAEKATGKLESGAWPEPTLAIQMFQVAKLYQDQARNADAARWYRKALAAFDGNGPRFAPNIRWAHRFLAESALSAADFPTAEKEYAALTAGGSSELEDYRALALASVRTRSFTQAADAWDQVVRIDPGNGDDARYSARLARMAAELPFLPVSSPSSRPWTALTKDELEATMAEQAKVVRETRAEVLTSAVTLDPGARAKMDSRCAEAKGNFLAAGLEYAIRRFPIRETAFAGGYAVLFFQPDEWILPPSS